jgi:hypothetical protein
MVEMNKIKPDSLWNIVKDIIDIKDPMVLLALIISLVSGFGMYNLGISIMKSIFFGLLVFLFLLFLHRLNENCKVKKIIREEKEKSVKIERVCDRFEVKKIAEKLGMTEDQILQFGIDGKIVFSILKPIFRSPKLPTISFDGSQDHPPELRYIASEDVYRIVENGKNDEDTLINKFFFTNDLDPKSGVIFSAPFKTRKEDLCISKDEWERFKKKYLTNPS